MPTRPHSRQLFCLVAVTIAMLAPITGAQSDAVDLSPKALERRSRALEKHGVSDSIAQITLNASASRKQGLDRKGEQASGVFTTVRYRLVVALPPTGGDELILYYEEYRQGREPGVVARHFRAEDPGETTTVALFNGEIDRFVGAGKADIRDEAAAFERLAINDARRAVRSFGRSLRIHTWTPESGARCLAFTPESQPDGTDSTITLSVEREPSPKFRDAEDFDRAIYGDGLSELATLHREQRDRFRSWSDGALGWPGSEQDGPDALPDRMYRVEFISAGEVSSTMTVPLPRTTSDRMLVLVEVFKDDGSLRHALAYEFAGQAPSGVGNFAGPSVMAERDDDDRSMARAQLLWQIPESVRVHLWCEELGLRRVALDVADPRYINDQAHGYVRLEPSEDYPDRASFEKRLAEVGVEREQRLARQRADAPRRAALDSPELLAQAYIEHLKGRGVIVSAEYKGWARHPRRSAGLEAGAPTSVGHGMDYLLHYIFEYRTQGGFIQKHDGYIATFADHDGKYFVSAVNIDGDESEMRWRP